MTELTLKEFWRKCRYHDWFYFMSDDPSVYRRGEDARKELTRLAASSPEFEEMYDRFIKSKQWTPTEGVVGPSIPEEPK